MKPNIEINGDIMTITVDIGAAAIEAAPLTKSGKSKMVSSTGMFETFGPVQVNLSVTAKK